LFAQEAMFAGNCKIAQQYYSNVLSNTQRYILKDSAKLAEIMNEKTCLLE